MQVKRCDDRRARVMGLCVGAGLAWSSAQATQVTAQWLAPVSGSWSDPTKWSTPQFPNNGSPAGTTYHAVIAAAGAPYTVTLGQAVTLDQLTLDAADATLQLVTGASLTLGSASHVSAGRLRMLGGSLRGDGDLHVSSAFEWQGGVLGFMGEAGRVIIESGGELLLTTGSTILLLNADIENHGSTLWNGNAIRFNSDSFINHGLMEVATDDTLATHRNFQGEASFVNNGLFRKTGLGNVVIEGLSGPVRFYNDGEVTVEGGGLHLRNGGVHTGEFALSAGSTLHLSGEHTFAAGSAIVGPGEVRVGFGSLVFDGTLDSVQTLTFVSGDAAFSQHVAGLAVDMQGGAAAFNGGVTLGASSSMTGGVLGGAGDALITGEFEWLGGEMSGSGRTIVSLGSELTMLAGSNRSIGRELRNDGLTTIGAGDVTLLSGGTLVNDGDFVIEHGAGEHVRILAAAGGGPLVNHGTMIKRGDGASSIGDSMQVVTFENDGLVRVEEGRLAIRAAAGLSGTLRVLEGAALELSSSQTIGGGLSVVGGGELILSGAGSAFVVDNNMSVGGVTVTGGAAADFNAAFRSDALRVESGSTARLHAGLAWGEAGRLTVIGGAAEFTSGQHELADSVVDDGTLSSVGRIALGGENSWTNAVFGGGGELVVNAGSELHLAGSAHRFDGDVENLGTIRLTTGVLSRLELGDGSTLRNTGAIVAESGTFEWMGAGRLENDGLIRKTGPGTLAVWSELDFSNTGEFAVESGSLRFHGPGEHSGTITLEEAGRLQLFGVMTFGADSVIEGAGELVVGIGAGVLALGGVDVGRATFSGGASTFATMASIDDVSVTGGSHTFVQGLDSERVAVSGGVLSAGAGGSPVQLTNDGEYRIAHGGALEVHGDFVNADGAALEFEVGGMKERGLSGLMTITGEASLAGTLSIETPEAFEATWGDRWVVMSYGSVEGDFDVFDLPTSGFASRSDEFGASDLRWYAERGDTEYAVGVSHIADIDHDGLVGFSDLNIVASNFNAFGSWAEGDVDGDGFVGFTDLNVVLSLFNVAAPRSVPGPGGFVVLAMFGIASGRRCRS